MDINTLDLENSILKALVLFPELLQSTELDKIAAAIHNPVNCKTFLVMRSLAEEAGPETPLEPLLIAHFNDAKRVQAFMDSPVINLREFPVICKQLSEYAQRRAFSHQLNQLSEVILDTDVPLVDAVAQIEDRSIGFTQQINNGSQRHLGRNGELISMREYLDTPDTADLKTELTDLDGVLKLRPGTLNIVAGRPAMGKSALGVFCADTFALGQNRPVLFVSLEMESRDLQARRIARHSKITHQRILGKKITPEQREIVLAWEEFINKAPLHYDVNPCSTLATIKASIRRVIQREGYVSAFFVDYLQLLSTSEQNKANELDNLSKGLRVLAREFNIPCIALAQLNRGVESQANKRPTMADIRSSGAIEQHADTITLVYRDDYYDSNSADAGITELIVSKNRNGPTGTVKILHELSINNYLSLLPRLNG